MFAVNGKLWLARNQDDTGKRVGWIWHGHFMRSCLSLYMTHVPREGWGMSRPIPMHPLLAGGIDRATPRPSSSGASSGAGKADYPSGRCRKTQPTSSHGIPVIHGLDIPMNLVTIVEPRRFQYVAAPSTQHSRCKPTPSNGNGIRGRVGNLPLVVQTSACQLSPEILLMRVYNG